MNHSIHSADRKTHLKVVAIALVAGTAVLAGIVAARVGATDKSPQSASVKARGPVVKAGAPVAVTSTDRSATR
jgi:hypothetical protein